ncbi:MAG: hypothetical protein J2P57_03900, partial [Acidimicrobiaceae bacterium]|nr:hypothetical protein [Acidimicrobiaceae bacterium]
GVDRAPTTAAAELMVAGLDAATQGEGDDLADLRRRNQELQRQNDDLRRALDEPGKKPAREVHQEREPRWEWPVDELLADRQWWDRWLPRLYELLGRVNPFEFEAQRPPVDRRGYSDLLSRLFPDAGSVTWRSPVYPSAVAGMAAEGAHPSAQAQVWEPVIRHVALALSALEETAQAGASPQLRLETVTRLTGSWVQALRRLAGQEMPRLPEPIR